MIMIPPNYFRNFVIFSENIMLAIHNGAERVSKFNRMMNFSATEQAHECIFVQGERFLHILTAKSL